MSKNFAEEYKALANEELPDLWNRIEAGLTSKTTALAEEELSLDMEQTIEPVGAEAKQEAEFEEKPEKGKVIRFLFRYRTVVAAAICVLVVLPAVILLGRGNNSKSSWESASDTVTEAQEEAPADHVASEEIYLAETDEVTEEAVAEEPEAEAGGAVQDNGSDGAEAYAEAARIEDLNTEGAAEKETDRQGNHSSSEAMSDEAADITGEEKAFLEIQKTDPDSHSSVNRKEKIFERVIVEAAEQTGETVEADKDIFYAVFMKVIEDPSGELEKGTEITVWVSMLSSVAYVQGQEYVLDLSYNPDRECPYQVKKNYFS